MLGSHGETPWPTKMTDSSMSALRSAVVHGVWDRLDDARPIVMVAIWPNEGVDRHERPVCVEASMWGATELVDGEARQMPCSPSVLALLRLTLSGAEDGVALYEVPIGEFGGGWPGSVCDAVVGLLARRKVREPARVAVRIAPEGGAVEDTVLTVRHSDGVVPLWHGCTMVPTLNSSFQRRQYSGFDMQLLGRPESSIEHTSVCVLCARFKERSRHFMALAPEVRLHDGARLATMRSVRTAATVPLILPDLRGAILDANSEERTMSRLRCFEKELIEAAWRPGRVAAWMGIIDT